MRAIGLVLAAFAFSLTFTTADAARRTDQSTSASRSSASRPAASVRPATTSTASRATARPAVATSSSRTGLVRTAYASPSQGGRSAAATTRRGGRQSTAAAAPSCARTLVRGRSVQRCTAGGGQTRLAWQSGLSPAAHIQTSDCPEGTMATLATGHTNVVRCMPL